MAWPKKKIFWLQKQILDFLIFLLGSKLILQSFSLVCLAFSYMETFIAVICCGRINLSIRLCKAYTPFGVNAVMLSFFLLFLFFPLQESPSYSITATSNDCKTVFLSHQTIQKFKCKIAIESHLHPLLVLVMLTFLLGQIWCVNGIELLTHLVYCFMLQMGW